MKIAFFYEYGEKREIGMGHKYRSQTLGKLLECNGHTVQYIEDGVLMSGTDILVVDHILTQSGMLKTAKHYGVKTVLIDGVGEDVELADLSISSQYNRNAQYVGGDYIVIPKCQSWMKYSPTRAKNTAFIAMGGFDANNTADFVLCALDELGVNAIVANSINHPNFRESFSRVEIFKEDDYYNAMHECTIAITNGGLSFFQALHYGMPTIAIPQYDHQKDNIMNYQHCCIPIERNHDQIKEQVSNLLENEYYRTSLSKLASHFVDGNGAQRICTLIESLHLEA